MRSVYAAKSIGVAPADTGDRGLANGEFAQQRHWVVASIVSQKKIRSVTCLWGLWVCHVSFSECLAIPISIAPLTAYVLWQMASGRYNDFGISLREQRRDAYLVVLDAARDLRLSGWRCPSSGDA